MSTCKTFNVPSIYYIKRNRGACYVLSGASDYYEVVFPIGKYRIELWGSSAGRTTNYVTKEGGRGGYVSGDILISETKSFYFYVGTAGTDSVKGTGGSAGYNGGSDGGTDTYNGDCGTGGSGGATDMRTKRGAWNDQMSLQSRIIVAGAGGSSGCLREKGFGGNAGGIAGSDGEMNTGTVAKGGSGGTQTSGYALGAGEKGKGGDESSGSGGGGYWGGYSGDNTYDQTGGAGGGGGSSYISGYEGCSLGSYRFTNTYMISGKKNGNI